VTGEYMERGVTGEYMEIGERSDRRIYGNTREE
jgi:hypothetical protein